jgi:hypothetical protein
MSYKLNWFTNDVPDEIFTVFEHDGTPVRCVLRHETTLEGVKKYVLYAGKGKIVNPDYINEYCTTHTGWGVSDVERMVQEGVHFPNLKKCESFESLEEAKEFVQSRVDSVTTPHDEKVAASVEKLKASFKKAEVEEEVVPEKIHEVVPNFEMNVQVDDEDEHVEDDAYFFPVEKDEDAKMFAKAIKEAKEKKELHEVVDEAVAQKNLREVVDEAVTQKDLREVVDEAVAQKELLAEGPVELGPALNQDYVKMPNPETYKGKAKEFMVVDSPTEVTPVMDVPNVTVTPLHKPLVVVNPNEADEKSTSEFYDVAPEKQKEEISQGVDEDSDIYKSTIAGILGANIEEKASAEVKNQPIDDFVSTVEQNKYLDFIKEQTAQKPIITMPEPTEPVNVPDQKEIPKFFRQRNESLLEEVITPENNPKPTSEEKASEPTAIVEQENKMLDPEKKQDSPILNEEELDGLNVVGGYDTDKKVKPEVLKLLYGEKADKTLNEQPEEIVKNNKAQISRNTVKSFEDSFDRLMKRIEDTQKRYNLD